VHWVLIAAALGLTLLSAPLAAAAQTTQLSPSSDSLELKAAPTPR
jgi:hypothetical protein